MSNKTQRGFSLVELLVVMVIAGILTMIAVPSYQASVIKSRRADGKVALNDIAQKLERCFTQFGAYNAVGCGIVNAQVIQSQEGFYAVTVAIPNASTYTLTSAPQGAQVSDAQCGSLGINNTGVRTKPGTSALQACW